MSEHLDRQQVLASCDNKMRYGDLWTDAELTAADLMEYGKQKLIRAKIFWRRRMTDKAVDDLEDVINILICARLRMSMEMAAEAEMARQQLEQLYNASSTEHDTGSQQPAVGSVLI